MQIRSLLKWYRLNKRDLPWRETKDPYLIWISEIILQQTRVDQGLPYYKRIIDKYPTIKHLALADKDQFFKLWQGLGYYNRAQNLLITAKYVHEHLKGKFPDRYDELIQLKGIGPYTAAAIASIAFNEPKAVLDGNVFRVLSRFYAIREGMDTAAGKNAFSSLAQEIMDKKSPADSNQAMMELGAVVCTPKNPLCQDCPVNQHCQAYITQTVDLYPSKAIKKKPAERNIHFLLILNKTKTYLIKREEDNIWKNLYEPPNFDHPKTKLTVHTLYREAIKQGILILQRDQPEISLAYQTRHILSHQTIQASFWIIQNGAVSEKLKRNALCIPIKSLKDYPVHRLFDKFLNYHNLQQ